MVKYFFCTYKMLCVFWFVLHLVAYWATVAFVRYVYYPHTEIDRNCADRSLVNQALSFPLFLAYERWRPVSFGTTHFLWQVPALYYLTDVYFYAFHRAFHTKTLYAAFHRVHHEYDDPCPENALHAHPVEHLVVNVGSIVVPLLVVKASTMLATFWSLPSRSTSWCRTRRSTHVLHHRHRTCNYGVASYAMDRLLGTYREDA